MKTYRININSNKRAILFAVILYPLSFYLMTLIPRNWNEVFHFATVAVLFFGPIYPVTLLSRGQILIELTDNCFRAIWLKRFLLSNEQDLELSWDRIINYVYQEDRGLDSFRLTLTNKQQFKFYRLTFFPQKDDFEKFLFKFPGFLSRVNMAHSMVIEQGKTDFQSKSFKWILAIMTVVAGVLLVNKVLNPDSGTGWPALGVILTGILYYWIQSRRN